MKTCLRTKLLPGFIFFIWLQLAISFTSSAQSDLCSAPPPTLTSAAACGVTAGSLTVGATYTAGSITTLGCGLAFDDVWYRFTANSTSPTITLSAVTIANVRIQLMSGACGSLVSVACGTTSIAATGLTPGTTYFIRIYSTANNVAGTFNICITDPAPANDLCANADTLVSSTTCVTTSGSLYNANSTVGVPGGCGNNGSADVWYIFVAQTAYPTITISGQGASFSGAGQRIQLLSGSCGALTNISCVTTSTLTTTGLFGGAGLTPGVAYYIRITTNTSTGVPTGGYAAWDFDICITDPVPATIDYSKSYVNVTKGTVGGNIDPGDVLEIRATFVVKAKSVDSVAYYDTLRSGGGLALVASTISTKTNEGKTFNSFSDGIDADAGDRRVVSGDTAIKIHIGLGATGSVRGKIRNTSIPSFYGSSCIIMATYRVTVYKQYNNKIKWGGGAFIFRDTATGVIDTIHFKSDSLIVYSSPGLCPNAVSAVNAVGVENNGTFGAPATGAPLARNRGTSPYVSGYVYNTFNPTTGGPQDYAYGIANNTSGRFSILQNIIKPDPASPQFRVFGLWDIIGDHTGATNTARGNAPCDTTKPVSATNPCGYMLVINSAYKTDTAFQYTVSSLCPNTYYEISAWVRNICYRCGCDVNGLGSGSAGYIPFATGDSSGVQPNLAFDIDGTDYYTTGNIPYYGTDKVLPRDTTSQKSDTLNIWVKRGFTFKTGLTQSSFKLTIRNNAPGGGGNDWAMDDISVTTCLPNMKYSPSTTPNVCRMNPLTLDDTVRSYFNNYVYYKWQRSTDNGSTWTDVTGPLGPSVPTFNGTTWEYITSYTIPPANTDTSDNGDKYRVVVATTAGNLSDANCQFTDGVSIINLVVNNCGIPLKTDLLSFNGKLVSDKGNLTWTTSKEETPVRFDVERSSDGNTFSPVGSLNSHNNHTATLNSYSLADPVSINGTVYYRLIMIDQSGVKKYSRTIQLATSSEHFSLTNVINPFNYSIDFDVNSPVETKIEVQLLDLFGKVVQKNSYLVHAGINALSLPNTENLPAGTYIFRVKNNEVLINRKVLKKSF